MSATDDRRRELLDLVVREARLIDDGEYEAWLDLFSDDGRYWIPLEHGQQDPLNHASLVYEDKLLLRMRVQRLMGSRAHSQQPRSRCLHVLQQPTLESSDGGVFVTRCAFSYFETRGEDQQVHGAVAWHRWILTGAGFRLQLKRVDLLHCEAALPSIQLFM